MTLCKPIDKVGREKPQFSITITQKSKGTVSSLKREQEQQKKDDNRILFSEHLHFPLIAELRVPGTS